MDLLGFADQCSTSTPVTSIGRRNCKGVRLCCRYGDCLRSGWRDILDCTVRLHKLGLLPAAVLRADGEGADAAVQRMPKPTLPPRSGSSAMLYRAFTRCRAAHQTRTPSSVLQSPPQHPMGQRAQASACCSVSCIVKIVISSHKNTATSSQ